MKKLSILLFLAMLFFACKTADSDTPTTYYTVTIDQTFGTGLSETSYKVEAGKTLSQGDLKGTPTVGPMLATYTKTDGSEFVLGQTPVNDNLALKIVWKDDPTLNCTGIDKSVGQLPTYASAGKTLEIACVLSTGDYVNTKFTNDTTALWSAADNKQFEAVKYLVAKGADLEAKAASNGTTPLIRATRNATLDMMQYLVSHGANINAKDTFNGGWTPAFYASSNGDVESLKYLLASGAKSDEIDNATSRQTILMVAAVAGKYEIVKYLIEDVKLDINGKDGNNWTALMFAVKYTAGTTQLETVKYLASYPGVDLTVRDSTTNADYGNKTALGIAIAGKSKYSSVKSVVDTYQLFIDYLQPLYTAAGITNP